MPRQLLKWILLAFVFLLIIGYAVFQSQDIVRGAEISISSPEEDFIATTSLLAIRGTAVRAAHIALDDSPIFTDPAGNFSEEIILAPGTNIIKLQVEDRYQRQKTTLLHIYYDAPADPFPPPIPAATSTLAASSTKSAR